MFWLIEAFTSYTKCPQGICMRCIKIALKCQDLKVASFWSLIMYLVSYCNWIFMLDQDYISR
jgi:hypothetical protein